MNNFLNIIRYLLVTITLFLIGSILYFTLLPLGLYGNYFEFIFNNGYIPTLYFIFIMLIQVAIFITYIIKKNNIAFILSVFYLLIDIYVFRIVNIAAIIQVVLFVIFLFILYRENKQQKNVPV